MSSSSPQRITADRAIHTMVDSDIPPEIRVGLGETFVLETMDTAFDLVTDESGPDLSRPPLQARQFARANPVAGPVYVEGVEAGDTLVVEIIAIDVRDWGWTGATPGGGAFRDLSGWEDLQGPWSTIIRHEPGESGTLRDGWAVAQLDREVRWRLAPFIGTLMVAPERGSEATVVSQGQWGGNIDVRDVCAGNRIQLQVTHDGGLLFAGDVHGSQGDSELSGIADETAAALTLRCHVIKQHAFPGLTRIETPTSLIQCESMRMEGGARSTIERAYRNLVDWLTTEHGMSKKEAYVHMTANSGVRSHIYQAVNGFLVVGVEFPKSSL